MRGFFMLLLVLCCIAFVWGGVGNTYVALTNTKPTALTCREFYDNPPSGKWFELSECEVDYANTVEVSYKFGVVEGYYVPLVPSGSTSDKSSILLTVPKLEQIRALIRKDKISGVAQFGIESDSSVREAIEKSNIKVADNYIILDPNEKPELGVSLVMLSLGLLIGWYLWRCAGRAAEVEKQTPATEQVLEEVFPRDGASASDESTREVVETFSR